MNFVIYTDAAHNPETTATGIGYVIHTDEHFVAMDAVPIGKMPSIPAESVAILTAIEQLEDKVNLASSDTVTIYTDNLKVVRYINGIEIVRGEHEEVIRKTVRAYKNLSQKCNVSIQWVQGHGKDYSQNNLVDRLAKYSIRYQQLKKGC